MNMLRTFVGTRAGQWLVLPLLAGALAFAPVVRAEVKPAVVVSVTSFDRILSDISYVTRLAGAPEVGGFVTLIAGQFTQGLDATKPAGMYVTFVDDAAVNVGFIPVKNLDIVLGNLRDQLGEPEDAGDGVLELGADRPQSMFLKKQGNWAFFSNEKQSLSDLPADPATLLGDLATRYDLAAEVHVRNIPAHLREMAISEMKRGFQQGLETQLDDEARRELIQGIGRNSLESIMVLIEGAERVTVGLNIDQEGARTYFDLAITAVEGSELAQQMAAAKGVKSQHSGFLMPDAAANLHFSARMAPRDIEQTKTMLQAMREEAQKELEQDRDLRTPEARAQAQEVVGAFFDIAQETVADGLLNGGAVVVIDGETLNFAAGGLVSDGKKFESAFRKLVDLAQREPNFPGVKFDAGTHGDYTFHTLNVPIPAKEKEARRVFGERLDVAVGIAPKSVYLGFGQKNMGLLKRVIDMSAQAPAELPPLQFSISLAPILNFAATVEADNAVLASLASAAREVSDNDSISLTSSLIERGVQYRFEIEEGVLQIIGQAVRISRQQQGNF